MLIILCIGAAVLLGGVGLVKVEPADRAKVAAGALSMTGTLVGLYGGHRIGSAVRSFPIAAVRLSRGRTAHREES